MDKRVELNNSKIIEGANKLADTVKITMGAKGKLVVIQDPKSFFPVLTKDGVTVADYTFLEDPFEDMGAKMMKQVTTRTLEEAEDATTTATVLTQALINNGVGKSARHIADTYKRDLQTTLKALDKLAKPVTDEQIFAVANVACNGDKETAKLVADAFLAVGRNGAVKVENTSLDESSFEVFEGMTVDSGLTMPHFATDKRKMECHLDNPYIFVYQDAIQGIDDIYPVIAFAEQEQAKIVIFAPDIEEKALHRLVLNNTQGRSTLVFVRTPEYGARKEDIESDICFVTKAEAQTIYKDIDLTGLGRAKEVVIRPHSTSVITEKKTEERIKDIEPLTKAEDGDFQVRRIKNLASKMVTIKVGGLTDIELREKRDRVDDAIGAVKSSFKGGVVAGAGNTFASLSKKLKLSEEFASALTAPMLTILENAEMQAVEESYTYNKGFDVAEGKFLNNLKNSGLIDSANSLKVALTSAVSVANNILNTGGVLLTT